MNRYDDAQLGALIDEAIARALNGDPRPAQPREAPPVSAADVAGMIDHTLLKPDATKAQVHWLCREAADMGFATVCVNPTWAPECVERLAESETGVCTVIGFPLGANDPEVKAFEAERALKEGAREVDMVLNVGRLKDKQYGYVYRDIAGVVKAAAAHRGLLGGRPGGLVKVIVETGLLTDEEKVAACVLAQAAGADFVKTSTGFSGGGATPEDIALMRAVVGPEMGVKASGGVRTGEDACRMIAAGASRIGASAGVQILNDLQGAASGPAEARGGY